MDRCPDLILRDAYVASEDAVVDVAMADGTVTAVEPEIPETATRELDVDGDLVSPGLVDAHVHLDMAFSAAGGRIPANNDQPLDREQCIRRTGEYFEQIPPDELAAKVRRAATMAVTNGVSHVRAHTYVDGTVGTKVVEAVQSVSDELVDVLDVEIVAFPQKGCLRDPGTEGALHEALDGSADVLGGIDPASINEGIEETVATWFDVATAHDVDVDAHLHDPGTLGTYTLERLADQTVERGYEGRVTASHCFALADAANGSETGPGLPRATRRRFEAADLRVVTCYQSMRPGMPIRQLHESGLAVAHGTDQVQDLWWSHGTADPLQALLVASLKLDTQQAYATNEGLAHLWRLVTTGGAQVVGRAESCGVEPGAPADVVVHGEPSPQWAIVRASTPRYVVKDGRVVAADGELRRGVTG